MSSYIDTIVEVSTNPDALILDASNIPDDVIQRLRHEFGYDLLDEEYAR